MENLSISERDIQNGIQNGRRLRSLAFLSAFQYLARQISGAVRREDPANADCRAS